MKSKEAKPVATDQMRKCGEDLWWGSQSQQVIWVIKLTTFSEITVILLLHQETRSHARNDTAPSVTCQGRPTHASHLIGSGGDAGTGLVWQGTSWPHRAPSSLPEAPGPETAPSFKAELGSQEKTPLMVSAGREQFTAKLIVKSTRCTGPLEETISSFLKTRTWAARGGFYNPDSSL